VARVPRHRCGRHRAELARHGGGGARPVVGFLLAFSGIAAFRCARTTIDPHRPEAASSLVVGGVYRYTRNPMYLGLTMLLLAWTLYLAVPAALAGPLLFAAYITRFQIIPEERVLAQKFGADYAAYLRKVRQWL
jgi:protein-S-isoprenylcysteine O-methyltransferase Ste14